MSDIQTVRMVRTEDGMTGDIHPNEVENMQAHGWMVDADYVPELHQDGPTVSEYVAAGYLASNYPPEGYASRSTEEEIVAAIAAQAAGSGDNGQDGDKIDLGTDSGDELSNEQLRAAIEAATGKAPHYNTGREKLVAQFNELNAAEAA